MSSLTPSGCKGTTRVEKIDSWRLDTALWRRPSVSVPILGWASKRSLVPDANLWRQNQWTRMLELQQKTRKNIRGLCFLSPHDMLFSLCSGKVGDSVFIRCFFFSPDDYFKIVVANNLLYLWIKTEFCEFVNFSHGEVATGSNYYLRRSDTTINTFARGGTNGYAYNHSFLYFYHGDKTMINDKFSGRLLSSFAWGIIGYRRRKWTRQHKFKSWTRLIAFRIALIPLGKVWIQLFSLQLWVNSRTD